MIRICRNKADIANYKEIGLLISNSKKTPSLTLSDKLFFEARQLFADDALIVSVLDSKGEFLFYLKECEDIIEYDGYKISLNTNYEGVDLTCEENLDTTLIEDVDIFVFYELEEYTYALTKFIRHSYPNKKVIYLDQHARYFFEGDSDITYVDSAWNIPTVDKGKNMYITSYEKNDLSVVPECVTYVYNSLNVINSLCWARKVSKLGSLNEDKTILLIDGDFGVGAGLAYIVRSACAYTQMAYERGWIPVINLTGNNMYIDNPEDNMWEQYFEPVSDISVADALKSSHVINVRENGGSYRAIHVNPYFRTIWHQMAKWKIRLRTDIEESFKKTRDAAFADKDVKVLGVLVRGTDTTWLKGVEEDNTAGLIEECKEAVTEGKYDKIFLATEDERYFYAFKEAFSERLIYVNQKRVSVDRRGGTQLIGKLLSIPLGKHREFGQQYLSVTYYLACCDGLLYNFPIGAYFLMKKWRITPMELERQIGTAGGQYVKGQLVQCLKLIKENTLTAIYGTGKIADKLFRYLETLSDKVIFCDKKATSESYEFHGYEVIAPDELMVLYRDGKIDDVIIASTKYGLEIEEELEKGGVPAGRILRICDGKEIF